MVLFVVNESSGNGRGKKVWAKVEAQLHKRGIEYHTVVSSSQDEAVIRMEELLLTGKMKAVAVIGGDGTLHGLLPLLVASGIPCGLIPAGSGNDTSRALGIPRNPIRALDIILAGHTRRIDVLETTSEQYKSQITLTAVAVGLDGAVAADVNGSGYKRWCNKLGVGSLAYIIGLFRSLAVFKPQSITVTIDGVTHDFTRGWLSAISNVSTYGGGLKICPKALPDDNLLHTCIVHSCSVWRILLIFPTLLNGSHVKQPYVTILSGRSVRIDAPKPFVAFGDGEPSGHTPLIATIVPAQLDFLTEASG
ncbi:diacylglycerol/lipid kinase family protein [Cohnella abietis]|uniref:Diacylglycerol kinase n=1 Tax=Cohnella abietis TaxID=2507935 RepID=A0A3T1D082_9BACL|nr:diacylglycerol kinase family protein [Cohnella abietis]BBI31471.1 diacylglycerol kinase [Cohnella abietis]